MKMRKYYQLLLVIVCVVSVVSLLIYRHEYNRLRYVLQVLNFFGKPGLTDADLCNVGFNATHLSALIKNSSSETDMYPVFQRIDDNFDAYSSFVRRNYLHQELDKNEDYNSVTDTIVLGKNSVEPNFDCHIWFDDKNSPAIGKFSFTKVVKSKVKNSHDIYLFHCKLKRDFGTATGVSYYPNYADVNPLYSSIHRLIDVSARPSYGDAVDKIRFVNKFHFTICVVPNRVPHVARSSIVEFLTFHQKMGATEFIIYDGTLSSDITIKLAILADDVISAGLRFFPLNFPISSNVSYNLMRDVTELDCLYRNFRSNKDVYDKASHVVTLSWDEFIVPRYHHTVKSLLNDYDAPRRMKQAEFAVFQFCLNQRDDPKTKPNYPDIIKKTHYDRSFANDRPVVVRTVGILNYDDIFDKEKAEKQIELFSQNVVAIHKYTDCLSSNHAKIHRNNDLAYAEFELRSHQFEGAMMKFAEDIYNSKLYTMYRMEKIWKLNKK